MMVKKAVRLAGLMQFVFYFALAAGVNYFTLYYKQLLTDASGTIHYEIIGTIMLVQGLAALLSPLLAGYLADRFQINNRLITICSIATAVGTGMIILAGLPVSAGLSISQKLMLIFPGAVIANFFIRPLTPLIDTGTLKALEGRDGHVDYYGRVRMMGSMGWIVSCILTGFLLDRTGRLNHSLTIYALVYLLLGIIATRGFNTSVKKVSLPWHYLLEDRVLRVLVIITALRMFGFGMGFLFTGVYLAELNMTYTQMGLAFGLAAILEIPFFFRGDYLLKRWGGKKLILADLVLQSLRFGIFFAFPHVQSPVFYIAVQTLMGLGVCLHLTGMIPLLNNIAPEHLKTSYQNIFTMAMAFANVFTGITASFVVSAWGTGALMGICCLIMIITFLYSFVFLCK